MRVAWLTSFLAHKSKIFSEAIVPELEESGWKVDLYLDDHSLEIASDGVHYHNLWSKHSSEPYDFFLYVIEDCPSSSFVIQTQKIFRGVSVFLDSNLNGLYLSKFAHSSSGKDINKEVIELFSKSAPKIGDWYERGWSIEVFDQLYRRGQRERQQSSFSFFTNSYACSKSGGAHLPFPVSKKMELPSEALLQLRTLVGPKSKTIAFSGVRVLEDRLPQIFDAISRLECRVNLLWLLKESEIQRAQQISKSYADHLEISFVTYNDEQALRNLIGLSDIYLGLRFDPERSWPLELYYALYDGVASVISASAAYLDIPEDAACRVELGVSETKEIYSCLLELLNNDKFSKAVSKKASSFMKLISSPTKVANLLKDDIEQGLLEIKHKQEIESKAYDDVRQNLLAGLEKDSPMYAKATKDFNWKRA